MASQLELERLLELGKDLGYEKEELRNIIAREREAIKEIERLERKEERERINEERVWAKEEEREERDRAREDREQEKQMLEIQLRIAQTTNPQSAPSPRGNRAPSPILPPFNQEKDDINRFERYAKVQGWDRDTEWAVALGTLLQCKALVEYSTLTA